MVQLSMYLLKFCLFFLLCKLYKSFKISKLVVLEFCLGLSKFGSLQDSYKNCEERNSAWLPVQF